MSAVEARIDVIRRRHKAEVIRRATNIIAAAAASLALFTTFPIFERLTDAVEDRVTQHEVTSGEIAELRGVDVKLRQELEQIRQTQRRLEDLPPGDRAAAEVSVLSGKVEAVDARLRRIEAVILSNPSKALELPLLRRDIEAIRETNTQALGAVKQSVDQVYDLNKWLLGGLAVGILSLAIGNFFGRKS